MLRRLSYLENSKVLADSGELVTDITVRDPITALWVMVTADNGASWNHANTLYDCISAIELIDGSEVLYSLTAIEALSLSCYQLGKMPKQVISELGTNPNVAHFLLKFGRFLGDTQYAFNPSRFVNPQFRIKWNLSAVRTVAATAFATGTGRLTLIADVLEGGPEPTGMLVGKQWYTWTTSNGGVEYIDLPIDLPIVSMMVRAQKATSYVDGVISKLKLACDGGKLVPFEADMFDLLMMMATKGHTFDYRHVFHAANGTTIYPLLKYEENMHLISEDIDDCVFTYPNYGYGEAALVVKVAGSSFASNVNIGAHVSGMCPYRHVYHSFGDDGAPDTWFMAPNFKTVRLEATGAVASGTGAIVLVQARPF